jgi:hypothetical protein
VKLQMIPSLEVIAASVLEIPNIKGLSETEILE